MSSHWLLVGVVKLVSNTFLWSGKSLISINSDLIDLPIDKLRNLLSTRKRKKYTSIGTDINVKDGDWLLWLIANGKYIPFEKGDFRVQSVSRYKHSICHNTWQY